MNPVVSWFESLSKSEANDLCDQLSGDQRFWNVMEQGLQGKMGSTELGYEILCVAQQIHEESREAAKVVDAMEVRALRQLEAV